MFAEFGTTGDLSTAIATFIEDKCEVFEGGETVSVRVLPYMTLLLLTPYHFLLLASRVAVAFSSQLTPKGSKT